MAFVLSLFVPHLSFVWCLWKAVLRDCGISWISSLIFSVDERFRELVTLGRLAALLYKGDRFCDFLFAFLHTKTLIRRILQMASFPCRIFSEERQNSFERVTPHQESVPFSLNYPHVGSRC